MSTTSPDGVRPDGVRWRGDGETVLVQSWEASSLRVRATRAGDLVDTDFALLPQPATQVDVRVDGDTVVVTNGRIVAVLTGLFHDCPADARCWDVADQYLFGPDILVAPVLKPGATSREVYLPAGASWTDLISGEVHAGGQTVVVDAPLAVVPVVTRVGHCVELAGLRVPT